MTEQRPAPFDMAAAGMDLITPALKKHPRSAIGGYNYEPRPEGYRRFQGFERVDGQGLPSAMKYYVLSFDAGITAISASETVTGLTSGATGKALVDAVVESGSWATNDATGYLVLWDLSGTFQDNEALQVSAVTRATADGVAVVDGATTDDNHNTWAKAAIDAKRALINVVAGSGRLRGAWVHNGDIYAFRNNAGGTACDMYKEANTGAGWVQIDLGQHIHFDAGLLVINEGDTVNGLTSGATAYVERVEVVTGDWSTSDAVGFIVISSVVGTFLDNEDLRVGTSKKADVDGVLVSANLEPNGSFEFIEHNFFGGAGTKRMYGCDGVSQAFEYNGSFAHIETGMVIDTPNHIGEKADHLILSFAGGSLQFSGFGHPHAWTVVLGAGEIGMGDEITGICKEYADGTAILSRNKTSMLYGTVLGTGGNAELKTLSKDAGAIEGSVQTMIKPTFYDNTGIRDLTAVQSYSNFKFGDGDGLSGAIKPLIDLKKKAGVSVTCSVVVKDQMQYWLFFDDQSALVLSMATGKPRLMPMSFPLVVRCAYSCEDGNGDEVIYFGSDDGYVYKMNSGNDFDGEDLEYLLRLAFWNLRTPALKKRFHKAQFEIDPAAGSGTTLNISVDFSYGNPDNPEVVSESFNITGGGGYWDTAYWDQFYWSQAVEGTAEAYIDGEGVNISTGLSGEASGEEPHTITSGMYLYSPRGLKR